ncbi:MAG: FecR domain-containing protein [Sphingomonadaceae bacterium]|nr:FecR domain-containing protein [Sphingomonadaceae bacterium]
MAQARFLPALIAGALSLGLVSGPALGQATRIGIASAVSGDVRMSNAKVTKPAKVAPKQRMAWGDRVSTAKKSQLQILLLDRSNFTIGAKTTLTIDRFVYDPAKSRSVGASVAKGAFRFMSGRRTPKADAEVKTRAGTIGIRGTMLDGVVGKSAVEIAKDEPSIGKVKSDEETATLVVLRGPGPAHEGSLTTGSATVTGAGKIVELTAPLMAAYIPREGAEPIGPFPLSPAGLSRLQDLLAPSVARARKKGKGWLPIAGAVAAIGAGVLVGTSGGDNGATADTGGQGCQPQPGAIC